MLEIQELVGLGEEDNEDDAEMGVKEEDNEDDGEERNNPATPMLKRKTVEVLYVLGVHWWYRTAIHAAELAAGFYNSSNRNGYAAIVAILKKHGATLNLTCAGVPLLRHQEEIQEALADPDGLVWQVRNAAWEACIPVASVNSFPCHDQEGYNKLLDDVKPGSNPDGRHFAAFTFLCISTVLMERNNFMQFERFVKRMHGLSVLDQQM